MPQRYIRTKYSHTLKKYENNEGIDLSAILGSRYLNTLYCWGLATFGDSIFFGFIRSQKLLMLLSRGARHNGNFTVYRVCPLVGYL